MSIFMWFRRVLLAASLTIKRKRLMESSCRLFPSVDRSVRKVYCGKTADWIRMPFGMVSAVGRGIDALDRGSDRRRGRGSFEVNLGHPVVTDGTL